MCTRKIPDIPRRGSAMMLVLVGLLTATIIATAYLASRDNSSLIGDNVASAGGARWAAVSGLELGLSIIASDSDWRTHHDDGRLLESHAYQNAFIDLDLVDLETGAAPTATTMHVRLVATADVEGIRQQASALAYLTPAGHAVDVDLSEFAMFAADRITMRHRATLTRWEGAPLSGLGRRIAIGSRGTSAGTITLEDDAAAIDTTVWHGPDASSELVSNDGEQHVHEETLRDDIPMPDSPDPGVEPTSPDAEPALTVTGQTRVVGEDTRWTEIELIGAQLHAQGDVTLVIEDDLRVRDASRILVNGNVRLIVFGDLELLGSRIELTGHATLALFVGGDMEIRDGFIGDNGASPASDGTAAYFDPQRVRIYGSSDGAWRLRDDSVVMGSIYAPGADFAMEDASALYGRVAAHRITLDDDAAVFYDHRLDQGLGYTSPASRAFDGDGFLLPLLHDLPPLDDDGLIDIDIDPDPGEGDEPTGDGGQRTGEASIDGAAETDTHDEAGGVALEPVVTNVNVEVSISGVGGTITTWESGAP